MLYGRTKMKHLKVMGESFHQIQVLSSPSLSFVTQQTKEERKVKQIMCYRQGYNMLEAK